MVRLTIPLALGRRPDRPEEPLAVSAAQEEVGVLDPEEPLPEEPLLPVLVAGLVRDR